jgi:hypothetical protein
VKWSEEEALSAGPAGELTCPLSLHFSTAQRCWHVRVLLTATAWGRSAGPKCQAPIKWVTSSRIDLYILGFCIFSIGSDGTFAISIRSFDASVVARFTLRIDCNVATRTCADARAEWSSNGWTMTGRGAACCNRATSSAPHAAARGSQTVRDEALHRVPPLRGARRGYRARQYDRAPVRRCGWLCESSKGDAR